MSIKALIIDDKNQNIATLKNILTSENYCDEKNIYPQQITTIELYGYANNIANLAKDSFESISNYIIEQVVDKEINLLFLDLQLTKGENIGDTTGEKIIEYLREHPLDYLRSLPIVVYSKFSRDEYNTHTKLGNAPIMYIHKGAGDLDTNSMKNEIENSGFAGNWENASERYLQIKDFYYEHHEKMKMLIDLISNPELFKQYKENAKTEPQKKVIKELENIFKNQKDISLASRLIKYFFCFDSEDIMENLKDISSNFMSEI